MPAANRSDDGPRFRVAVRMIDSRRREVLIEDDDFGYDATLELTGDFLHNDKVRYAQAVATALNAAEIPTPTDTEVKHGD